MISLLIATALAGPGHLLVVNQGDKTVSVIDLVTNKVERTIDEHQTTMHGHEVCASPDGKFAYVPIYGDVGVGGNGLDGNEILKIDVHTGDIVGRLDFGHGVRPHCIVYEPARKLLYCTSEIDQTVSIIDPGSFEVIGSVPTGQEQSHMLAITRDGRIGYVSNVSTGTVSVLDLAERKLKTTVKVSSRTQRICLSENDRWAFAGDDSANRMAVIDTRTNQVAKWIDLPGHCFGSAVTPDNKWLLIPVPSKNVVCVVDLRTMGVTKTIPVDAAPQEMLIRPDGKFAYVAAMRAGKVCVIDLTSWTMTQTISVGTGPDGLGWAR